MAAMPDAVQLGIRHMRLTHDDYRMNRGLAGRRWLDRATHAGIFRILVPGARRMMQARGIRHTEFVFGLLQDSHVDEPFVLKLLPELPAGDSELYSHPSLDKFKHEFDALVSPRVKEQVARLGIQLIRYQDL